MDSRDKSIDQSTSEATDPNTSLGTVDQELEAVSSPTTPAKVESSASLLEDSQIAKILQSDSAMDILLDRLKRSITTCDEFSRYIKKKSILEDDHYTQLRKISKHTQDTLKNDGKKFKTDSFERSFEKIVSFDSELFNVGSPYVKALTLMYEQLGSLASTVSKSRKSVKEEYRRKERECGDTIAAAEKSKNKYFNFCNELEKLRTGDPSKKTFTLKGSKTGTQQEEELSRKIEIADQDYRAKVHQCKKLKDELLMVHRPAQVKALKGLILEIDTAMSLQLQKYTTWNETLVMRSGILISPLHEDSNKPSIKKIAASVDNEKDLYEFLTKQGTTSLNRWLTPVEYKVHPLLGNNLRKDSQRRNITPTSGAVAGAAVGAGVGAASSSPLSPLPASTSYSPTLDPKVVGSRLSGPRELQVSEIASTVSVPPGVKQNLATFGVPIDVLVDNDTGSVPAIVRQCIQVIEKYGLDLEGIYRVSASVTKVKELRELIDRDPANIALIGPSSPDHVLDDDIYVAATILKLFFKSLPEPLLTNVLYQDFLDAVKDDSGSTKISTRLHQIAYELPDGPYWTLRSLLFHLNKIAAHQDVNRMTIRSLSIVWGEVLLYSEVANTEDMSYKAKVVEELLKAANLIYEAEP
ncbi:hypothetical protein LJB42_003394 [Komagataella kurtzmanii]|nr:hypothetical protein LJB42_003394 [Komagataella kurtzmanii]